MNPTQSPPPPEGHVCPDPLTQLVTLDQLADRLGVGPSAIREHLRAGTASDWLPRPAGRIGRSWVWRIDQLTEIESARRRPGHHIARPVDAAGIVESGAVLDNVVPDDDDGFWDDEGTPAPTA